MTDIDLAPDPKLMESMRAVGYSTETALADIIDNSVSACAGTIDVEFSAFPAAYVAIVDDGHGMDRETLIEAMRLAGRSPSESRELHDLGRFGLGLKTASLSQCRCLTVASKRDGSVSGVRWSLDHIAQTGSWALQVLGHEELETVPGIERLSARQSGTIVLWTDLDRLLGDAVDGEVELDERMATARDHVALVYHRFIQEAVPPLSRPLSISFNGRSVPQRDPFLAGHRGVQVGPEERFAVRGVPVTAKPYTLPYLTNLSRRDRDRASVGSSLRDSQGFYIYRAARLVQWGTWFRLAAKTDLAKLARVRVDIPNTLDDLWSLDIKKSAAVPPAELRLQLRRIAGQIIQPSRRAHQYRGRAADDGQVRRLWGLIEERETFRYEIDREHPAVVALAQLLPDGAERELDRLLDALQSTFPVEDAYNRIASDRAHVRPELDEHEVVELARALQTLYGGDAKVLARRLATVEPFNEVDDLESFLSRVLS
jgi:hypothetical protein